MTITLNKPIPTRKLDFTSGRHRSLIPTKCLNEGCTLKTVEVDGICVPCKVAIKRERMYKELERKGG
jgi:hypothetical protein